MNKYQKALENIITKDKFVIGYLDPEYGADTYEVEIDMNNEFPKELELLQELVDRTTPMKPIVTGSKVFCKNCGGYITDLHVVFGFVRPKFHSDCGQKLDWSKSDE